MNDLERDLHELFEHHSRDVDPSVLAPGTVLRRGRRRQARTALGGALAAVVAIAVAVAAVGSIARPQDITPGGNQLQERVTKIGGVPVTAPAGWTLINDWPLAAYMATSTAQTCSFTATGTAVDGNGSPIEASPQPEPSQACTSEPTSLPAGLPVLQLANFEIPLMETVCGLGDSESATPVPADGVAVYVGDFTDGWDVDRIDQACPSALPTSLASGRPVNTTFADKDLTSVYGAVLVTGSAPSADDVDIAQAYIESLDIRITPTAPDSTPGPGYVLAAGTNGEETWRLEAGMIDFDRQDGTPTLGATLVTTTPTDEGSRTLPAATPASPVTDDYGDVGDAVVQFGTASNDVTAINVVAPDGGTTRATMLAWPLELGTLPYPVSPPAGQLWFAQGSTRGEVRPTFADSAPLTPTPTEPPSADSLRTRTTSDGGLVAYGNDLGHDWEIQHGNGEIQFFVDGLHTPEGSFSFSNGASTGVDIDGGTFMIGVFDPSVTSWSVDVDATDSAPAHTIDGRYTPAQDAAGHPANLWLLALPGSGTGTATGASTLPTFVAWPQLLYPDGLFGAGSDGLVSWGIAHHSDQCALVKVIAADPTDSGTSDCLPSWKELSRNGNTPLIGGFYGEQTATVVIVLPSETPVTVSGRTPDCFTVNMESNFDNTEFCVFSLGADEGTHVAFGEHWNALGGPIELIQRPGALDLNDPMSTTLP